MVAPMLQTKHQNRSDRREFVGTSAPDLSVVVPVRNGARYLGPCVACLEALGDAMTIEVIVQDACSTDGTTELLAAVAERRRDWVHVVERDGGQSDAINRGVARARAPWVTWLCADDLLLPDFLAAFRGGAAAGADVVYGDVVFVDADGAHPACGTETHGPGALARRRMIIQQPGTVIRREKWLAAGGVDLRHNWAMDYDLFLRLESAGARFHRVRAFVAAAMLHPEAKTSSPSFRRVLEMWRIVSAAHMRAPRHLRLNPYLLYLLEYIIKNMEARRGEAERGAVLRGLHRLFWKLSVPVELADIDARYAAEKSRFDDWLARFPTVEA